MDTTIYEKGEKYFSLTKSAYLAFLIILFMTITIIPVIIFLCF